MVEDAVRRDTAATDAPSPSETPVPDTAPGAIDGAGLTPATKLRPPGLLELENLLAEQLDTRVSVQLTAKRGRVTIEFADLEDLERIYRVIVG
jgi:ParB family chromosome partitioning protein